MIEIRLLSVMETKSKYKARAKVRKNIKGWKRNPKQVHAQLMFFGITKKSKWCIYPRIPIPARVFRRHLTQFLVNIKASVYLIKLIILPLYSLYPQLLYEHPKKDQCGCKMPDIKRGDVIIVPGFVTQPERKRKDPSKEQVFRFA